MKYRREIDGLRALAVIPVILFHAGFTAFSGGFVGVDVFFVISGYLITTVVISELQLGKFSLTIFYERRARRILPALTLVLVVCLPFAWLWLLPGAMHDFARSLVAVSVFASNIEFWRESNYFDAAAELKPLLHTWSLAVEEQFYVLFPLFLMLAWRLGKKWIIGILVLIFLLSLAAAQWGVHVRPAATFYLLPSRGWELVIGALVAFYFARQQPARSPPVADLLLSISGLALIFLSIFAYSEATPYPSLYALAPTVGTALIILFAWPHHFVGRLLGSNALVGIGLISYSAYLWHQPLFALVRNRSLDEPGTGAILALSGVTFVLAYLSWRYVETPFRDREQVTKRSLLCFSATATVVIFSTGLALTLVSPRVENALQVEAETLYRLDKCFFNWSQTYQTLLQNSCDSNGILPPKTGASTTQKRYVLYGDSIAAHLYPGLKSTLGEENVIQLTGSSCRAIRSTNNKRCDDFYDWFVSQYLASNKVDAIVISSSWLKEFRQLGDKSFRIELDRLFDKLRGVRVIIYSQPASLSKNVATYILKLKKLSLDVPKTLELETDSLDDVNNVLGEEAAKFGFEFIDVSKYFCNRRKCLVIENGTFYFWDSLHLTKAGSELLAAKTHYVFE